MYSILALNCFTKSRICSSLGYKVRNLLNYNTNANLLAGSHGLATKSNANASTRSTPDINNDEWRTIYRLPMISLASAFNRVKTPYAILNAFVVPASFALEQSAILPPSMALVISAVGITSLLTLSIVSLVIRNLIGIIYINDNNDKLKLSYVDYFGKRRDVCVEVNDIIPEIEKPKILMPFANTYQLFGLNSDDNISFKLLQRFGRIENPEVFLAIFGDK